METFKLVLPSNVSHEHFPNNTSSHYQTYLHNPIQLEGKWEVAAESIYYSANIENEKENGSLHLDINHKKSVAINENYPWQFKTNKENKWLGYEGVIMSIPSTTIAMYQLITALNQVNNLILKDASQTLFEFTIEASSKVSYRCKSPNFTLKISSYLAFHLGFDRNHMSFSGIGPYIGKNVAKKSITFDKRENYNLHVYFFHTQIVKHERRILLKDIGESCDHKTILDLWKKRVQNVDNSGNKSGINVAMEYSRNNKLVLHHNEHLKCLVFSPELAKAIGQHSPLMHGTRWSGKGLQTTKNMIREQWYIDIYNSDLETTDHYEKVSVDFYFRLRPFPSMTSMLSYINQSINTLIKNKTQNGYDIEKHAFILTQSNQRITLNLGRWLNLVCSSNVSQLLGFDKRTFDSGSHVGTTPPFLTNEQSQRVLLTTDVIDYISYGDQKLRVLQDFVHVIKGCDIIEKRFQPLSFIPIIRNYIDTISIQLINEEHEQITAKDVKTVVVLHFKRVK